MVGKVEIKVAIIVVVTPRYTLAIPGVVQRAAGDVREGAAAVVSEQFVHLGVICEVEVEVTVVVVVAPRYASAIPSVAQGAIGGVDERAFAVIAE